MTNRLNTEIWVEQEGAGPLFATAIHAGHEIRRELLPLLALDDFERAHEEDPYTDSWLKVVPSWIAFRRSRFEVDLNRKRNEAVYLTPEMAWGLHVWKHAPSQSMVEHSLKEYDAFYAELGDLLEKLAAHYKRFVIFDLHSYNYRRAGPYLPAEDPGLNPEVNVGTGSINRKTCGGIIERFIRDLRGFDFPGHPLDVRENVKFRGRQLAQWIHKKFPESACVLSVEFKKFFMDEWTGVGDLDQIEAIRQALHATLPGILDELRKTPE